MIYGCTGHRPKRLTLGVLRPYSSEQSRVVTRLAMACFQRLKPSKVYVRMALGWDQACARACTLLGIPWVAVIPCSNYEKTWPEAAQREYHALLKKASKIIYLSKQPYSAERLEQADQWMVRQVQAVLALWDEHPTGGTAKCVAYAKSRGVKVVNAWSHFVTMPKTTRSNNA
jgi:uncharacterized phage-like protein YoqJ